MMTMITTTMRILLVAITKVMMLLMKKGVVIDLTHLKKGAFVIPKQNF